MLVLKMRIYLNMIMTRETFGYNKNFAFASAQFLLQETRGKCRTRIRLTQHEGAPNTHTPQTPTGLGLPCHHVCDEPQRSPSGSTRFPRGPSRAISRQLTSCNPSNTQVSEPISVLFQIKGHIYCSSYVLFNHLLYKIAVFLFFLVGSYHLFSPPLHPSPSIIFMCV